MKSIPAVAVALLLLPLPQSPAPLPEPAPPIVAAPLAPTEAPTAFDPVVRATSSTTDTTRLDPRPRWPEGWPSVDLSPAPMGLRAAAEFQTMAVGGLDVVLEGTGEPQVVSGADPAEVGDRRLNYSNLFLIDGVRPNENIRGQAFDLFIEDAIQEVATAVAGVSVRPGGGADPGEVGDRQTGILSGTVVDSQGNPLPGALVTMTGIESGKVDQFTNDLGEFRFDGLPPGQRTLFVELDGLSRVEYPDVVIRGGTETTVDVTLSPAVVAEEIVVTGRNASVTEVQTGVTITRIELEELPIARDHWGDIALAPGLISDGINVGGNESVQQEVPTGPGTDDDESVFAADGVIITDLSTLGGSPRYGSLVNPLEDLFEDRQAATDGPDFPPLGGVTIDAITGRGTNDGRTSVGSIPRGFWVGDPEDWDLTPADRDLLIHIGLQPNGISCFAGYEISSDLEGPRPDPQALQTGNYIGVVIPSLYLTLAGDGGSKVFEQPGPGPGIRVVEFPNCGEGPNLYAFDIPPWHPFLLSTEGGPTDLPGAEGETRDAPAGEEVTFRLADGTAGVDVTLIDLGERRRLGTTGEDGVSRVPAEEVEDGTALIAYAVVCGEDKQIVLVRPEDEEAFLDAYGDCAGRRLERFAWFAGDVFVDVRGLARWIPSASEAPQPETDPAEVGDRRTGTLSGTVVDTEGNPLPGVIVAVAGIRSPAVQVTGARGEFRFHNVPPGELRLTAEREGFSTVSYPDVSIGTGTNTTVEVTLSPAVEEVITVTSESPLLDERKIQQGTTISQIELDKIPTARDPWAVITQTPGVISDRISVGGNESGQQEVFTGPGMSDGESSFAVDGVIITDMAAIGSFRSLYDFDSFEELEAATGGTEAALPSGGLTINLVPPRASNNPRASARYLLSDEQASANWGQIEIDIAEAPDRTSCVDRFAVNDTAGNPLPDAAQLGPEEWVGIVPDSSLHMTLDGLQGDLDPRTWILGFPACDGDEGQLLYAFDFDRWIRSLLTTEAGPADLPEATAETGDAPTGDQVTFLLADGTAGVDVTLFERDGPRRLGTTGEGGVTRVPAGEVEDGTALIAYAVACGDEKQIVLVRPQDEEAFLDAYGECAGRRLERFAWFAGDVLVDVRGLARWRPYPQAPRPADDLDPVTSPEAFGDPSGLGGADSDIQVVILSTGGSTGMVVEAYLVNHGLEPVRIRSHGLVLKPVTEEELDPAARARMQEILDAFSSGQPVSPPQAGTEAREARVVRVGLPAYCLEFAKDVPVEGTLFRIADREAQQKAAPFREIVRASRRLQERGALHPDGDPESYFHSTRQWAAWADELELDRDSFEEAFVEHARKNFDAAGRPWTVEVEQQVRALVPNRWANITTVLDEADSSLRGDDPRRSR